MWFIFSFLLEHAKDFSCIIYDIQYISKHFSKMVVFKFKLTVILLAILELNKMPLCLFFSPHKTEIIEIGYTKSTGLLNDQGSSANSTDQQVCFSKQISVCILHPGKAYCRINILLILLSFLKVMLVDDCCVLPLVQTVLRYCQ